MACTISPEEIKRVKGMGFLHNKGTDCFSARVLTVNGKITADQAAILTEAARTYGSGELEFTVRLTVEVPGIHFDNIPAFQAMIAQAGLVTGGTGPLVRPVVSCKGTTCQYGLYDTYSFAERIHKTFYEGWHDVKLPHKFKIALGGCPNNCVKPNLNDLGIIGQHIPRVDADKCRGCKVCQVEKACPIHVASLRDGKIDIDPTRCNHCGRCQGSCPFDAVADYQDGFKITIGGRWGKKTAQGRALTKIFTSEDEVLEVVERAILLFRDRGLPGERFADTVARLGFDEVNRALIGE